MLRRAVVFTVFTAAACAPASPPAVMPATAPAGAVTTDRITAARQDASAFFRAPQAGQPAQAARAIADLEFLASAVPTDPRWQTASANALTQLSQARDQGRRALGVAPRADAQAVIDGLLGASRGLEANDRAAVAQALPRNVFTLGPDQTVQRLAAPPRIPSASGALLALSAGPSPR